MYGATLPNKYSKNKKDTSDLKQGLNIVVVNKLCGFNPTLQISADKTCISQEFQAFYFQTVDATYIQENQLS